MTPDGSCGESRLHKNDVSDGVAAVKPVPTSWILLVIREIEMVMLVASQLFWLRRILDLGERFIPRKPRSAWLAVITGAVYLFFFAYSFTHLGVIHQATMGHIAGPADPR